MTTIHPLPPRLSSSLDAVWAATYAAAFVAQLREEERITGITAPDDDDADRIAEDAATLADHDRDRMIDTRGQPHCTLEAASPDAVPMSRVGKSAAGRHLDGRTHDEVPEALREARGERSGAKLEARR